MTCLPARLTAGDSWSLDLGGTDHPAPQWAMALVLIPESAGSVPVTLAASWDGSSWTVTAAASVTAALSPGLMSWRALATDAAGDARDTLGSGRVEVLPDPAGGGDLRSVARRNLDAIEQALADPSWIGASTYTIEGRSLSRRSTSELLTLRAVWAAAVRSEEGRSVFHAITPRLAR